MTKRRSRPQGFGTKWIVLGVLVALGAYFGPTYLKRARTPSYPPNAFFEVKRGDMLISITEEGALRALNETAVRSGLEGLNRIIRLVPEGAHVKKGELIVELDSSGFRDRLNEQELSYQERLFQLLQAQSNLKIQKSLGESAIKEGELKIENAESDLEKYRDGDAPLLVRTVEARAGILREQVRIAAERYARTQDLFKSGNATRSELEADALTLNREKLGLTQYEEDLRLIQKYDRPQQVRLLESKVQQAKEELERLRQRTSNEVAQAEADLKTSERTVATLAESVKTIKRRLENAKIYAPQDGLVVYAPISPFQSFGDSSGGGGRGAEGRLRGNRGSGGGGGNDGEYRGGGRRGGRSSLETSSSGASGGSTAQSVSAANQRIASAISGTSAAQGSAGGGAANGGRSSGGGGGSSGSGGQGTTTASTVFQAYPSMRPSSTIPVANANAANAGTGVSSAISSLSSSGNSPSSSSSGPQFNFRSRTPYYGDYSYGTPGILEEGTMVRQRQELIRLPDVSKMIAEIKVHESRVRQVRPGMAAYIKIENIPDRKFKGTVRRVAPLPDSQMSWMNPDLKVYPTDVLIVDELPNLKPGVSARTEIIITNLTAVLTVPIQTVARFKGENVCFVKRGKGVTPVPVTTGWFNDLYVEVTSGLKEGDKVMLAAAGDEDLESTNGDTNEVEAAAPETVKQAQPAEESSPTQGRGPEAKTPPAATDGDAQPERRRERQGGGRRRRTEQESPE